MRRRKRREPPRNNAREPHDVAYQLALALAPAHWKLTVGSGLNDEFGDHGAEEAEPVNRVVRVRLLSYAEDASRIATRRQVFGHFAPVPAELCRKRIYNSLN